MESDLIRVMPTEYSNYSNDYMEEANIPEQELDWQYAKKLRQIMAGRL